MPARSSTCFWNASAPLRPSKKVTALMPITRWSGAQVSTLRTASSVFWPISFAPAMKLSFDIALVSGVKMRL